MSVQAWTFTLVGLSFALYVGIAVWSRAREVDPELRLPAAYARQFAERFGNVTPLESIFQ